MPPPMPPPNYGAPPPPQGMPPAVSYSPYAPPPPRKGLPAWAWALIGCGGCLVIALVLIPIMGAIMFPVFGSARAAGRQASCLSNMKQMALATRMYVLDYDDQLPMAATWQDGVAYYVKNKEIFHCPEVSPAGEGSVLSGTTYAFNSALDQLPTTRLAEPQTAVLNFETTHFSPNASDAVSSLPNPARHRKTTGAGNNFSFADGHAEFWPEANPLPEVKILTETPETATPDTAPSQ